MSGFLRKKYTAKGATCEATRREERRSQESQLDRRGEQVAKSLLRS